MKKVFLMALAIFLVCGLIGCVEVSKPYVMKTDREDQELSAGNRGYLKGNAPEPKDRGDLKRPWIAVDVDLPEFAGKKSAAKASSAEEVK